MKRSEIQKFRKLVSEFSRKLGNETLRVRIYHDRNNFICERRLVERDGTSFTMVMPFTEPQAVRMFLSSDPYYGRVRREVGQVLIRLNRTWRGANGKALT